jgi:hypothetical protein
LQLVVHFYLIAVRQHDAHRLGSPSTSGELGGAGRWQRQTRVFPPAVSHPSWGTSLWFLFFHGTTYSEELLGGGRTSRVRQRVLVRVTRTWGREVLV